MAYTNHYTGNFPNETVLPIKTRNRIEGRQSQVEFTDSLAAKSFDPLWFITRQFQFGELRGEDAGSPISANLELKETPFTHLKGEDASWVSLTEQDIPMEVYIESLEMKFTLHQKAAMGKSFLAIVQSLAPDGEAVKQALLADDAFRFQLIEEAVAGDVSNNFEKVRQNSDAKSIKQRRFLSTRVPDGLKLYNDITSNGAAALAVVFQSAGLTDAAIITNIQDSYTSTIEKRYRIQAFETWRREQMAYSGEIGLAEQGDPQSFTVENYHADQLDWHSLDKKIHEIDANLPSDVSPTTRYSTGVPTQARFRGMPLARWWEMEDASIDYANIEAEDNEIVKLLISEFALVYANDWFTMPFKYFSGSNLEMVKVKVHDVFGETTEITKSVHEGVRQNGAIDPVQRPADEWSFFKQDASRFQSNISGNAAYENHYSKEQLFVPDVLPFVQKSDPVERINLIRDEVDNQIWGIELKQFSESQGSIDSDLYSNRLEQYLRSLLQVPEVIVSDVALEYKLQTESPSNWVPFLPVKVNADNVRDYVLVRGKTIKTLGGTQIPNRPVTDLLSKGLNPQTLAQESSMVLYNEQVPRAGLILEDTYQRTRWYGGKTMLWLGRRKKYGKLVNSNPIQFDQLIQRTVDNGQPT